MGTRRRTQSERLGSSVTHNEPSVGADAQAKGACRIGVKVPKFRRSCRQAPAASAKAAVNLGSTDRVAARQVIAADAVRSRHCPYPRSAVTMIALPGW